MTSATPSTHPIAAPTDRFSRWRKYTTAVVWANLIGQIVIILTGGLVRLTGSGLGCSTWPMCEPGSFTPQLHEATSYHPFIEFGNRTLTGVLLVIAVAVVLLVATDPGRSRQYRLLGWVPFAGVMLQAVVGGLSVLLELSPVVVGFHLLISMALVAASTYLVVRTREGDGPARWLIGTPVRRTLLALEIWLVPVLILGVLTTGSGPHSGDETRGYRFALDPAVMARAHGISVWIFLAILALLTYWLLRRPARAEIALTDSGHIPARRELLAVWALVGVQAIVGYTQYFTGLPIGLVAIHMLLAACLTAAVVALAGALRTRS